MDGYVPFVDYDGPSLTSSERLHAPKFNQTACVPTVETFKFYCSNWQSNPLRERFGWDDYTQCCTHYFWADPNHTVTTQTFSQNEKWYTGHRYLCFEAVRDKPAQGDKDEPVGDADKARSVAQQQAAAEKAAQADTKAAPQSVEDADAALSSIQQCEDADAALSTIKDYIAALEKRATDAEAALSAAKKARDDAQKQCRDLRGRISTCEGGKLTRRGVGPEHVVAWHGQMELTRSETGPETGYWQTCEVNVMNTPDDPYGDGSIKEFCDFDFDSTLFE